MAAHQRDVVAGEAARQVASVVHVAHQEVGVAELVGDVPHRHVRADEAAGVDHRAQRRRLGDAERECVLGVRMHDGLDVGPRLEDRGVDEALEVERTRLVAHRLAVEPELDDVVALDQLGRERAREEEVLRLVGMADADMAIGVDHVLLGQDAVGDDEIVEESVSCS